MRVAGRRLSVSTAAVLVGFVLGIAGCAQEQATTVTQEASKPDAAVTAEATKPAEPVRIDPDEPVSLAVLAQEFDLEFPELEKVEQFRGSKKGGKIYILYPRKDVRKVDLDRFRVDVTDEFAREGTIEFRRGKDVLYSAPFEPERFETIIDVPAAVASAVQLGDRVTWGFYPKEGRPVTAQFRVVKERKKVTKRVDALEQRLKKDHPVVLASLKAQVFLDNKLYYAAYREAWAVVRTGQAPVEACAIVQASVRRMGLKKTPLWDAAQEAAGVAVRGYRGRYGPGPRR